MCSNYSIESDANNLYIKVSLNNNSRNQANDNSRNPTHDNSRNLSHENIDFATEKPNFYSHFNKNALMRNSYLSKVNPPNIRGGFFYATSFDLNTGSFVGNYYV
jgi:hypothetical protein